MKSWYVARTKPQKERLLEATLARLDVQSFLPRIMVHRRGKRVLEPLFPSYIFCRVEHDTPDWPAIRWAPGLSYFLGVDGSPTCVPDELVEYVGMGVDKWNSKDGSAQQLTRGDSVRVSNGPFEGLEGVFQSYANAHERCRILLHVVGRLTSVEVSATDLQMSPAVL